MDFHTILLLAKEFLFVIVLFGCFLIIALWWGRYTLVNVLLSFYVALLMTIHFPFFETTKIHQSASDSALQISFFLVVSLFGTFLFRKLIPGDDFEKSFDNFAIKFLLALSTTIVVLAICYHVLPVSDLLPPESLLERYFDSENLFWGWLLLPLLVIFLV